MDALTEMAKMFKERENDPYMGPQTGTVVTPPPGIQVRLGDKIILDKDHLIIAAHVLADYQRDVKMSSVTGKTTLIKPPPPQLPVTYSETFGIESTELEGTMKYTDTLQPGDEVILLPTTDRQVYFLIDKAVRL